MSLCEFSISPLLSSTHSCHVATTPPLLIDEKSEQPLPLQHSKEREFQTIVEQSLLSRNSGRQLRDVCKRRRPISFDEYQFEREKGIVNHKQSKKKEKSLHCQDIKREERLIEFLKCKVWECLVMRARYPKRTSISVDIACYEDAHLWSHLFDQEEMFLQFSSPSSHSSKMPLHHQKKNVWTTSILCPDQVGNWLPSILKCYQDHHCVEVMLHNGVIKSDPSPLNVSLNYHECMSWKSQSNDFGDDVDLSTVYLSSRYSLDLSFRISCTKVYYE